ncbi:MAG: hypothetical protein LBS74_09245 [Oscillospiraceae bacterium]|jgi:dienelactone hydrolase|nr:hypothetical protein [Oscillospiraceae bacterium]
MKKIIALLLCISIITALAACNSGNSSEKNNKNKLDMPFKLADSSKIKAHEFNFGESDLKNHAGEAVPCPLDGIIAAPNDSGKHPLVVILHGVAPIKTVYDKIYSGFDYLAEQLAAQGYVVMSFNLNIEYYDFDNKGESSNLEWGYALFKQQMALLEKANAGDSAVNSQYGIDLSGKIDFENVHLMGHSRGGELADAFIQMEKKEGLSRIKSLVCIEAAAYYPPHPDIPIGFIIGEFDGDVPEEGQAVFDDLQKDPNRTAPASIVFLRSANHAYFNRTFTWEHEEKDKRDMSSLLTREKQEDFLKHYASAFLSVYAKGEAPFGIWDNKQWQPDTMFGFAVTASNYVPGRQSILEVSEAAKAKLTANGKAELKFFIKKANDNVLFTHPGATMSDSTLPLYNISWSGKDGILSIPCETNDFSSSSSISLYVAVDSSDKLNAKDKQQSFTLTLKDKSGKTQDIIPQHASALSYYPGYATHLEADEFAPAYDIWNGFMPLGELRIPLTVFDKIDLKNISEITLNFNQTDSGSVMLSGVYLDK